MACSYHSSAIDNTATPTSDSSVSVYWLNGEKVADNYADLYDGSWNSNQPKFPDGTDAPRSGHAGRVTHGCQTSGRSHEEHYIGAALVMAGQPGNSGSELAGVALSQDLPLRFYGLSGIFQVTARTNSVPAFSDVTLTRGIAENTPAGVDIGDAIPAATDADDDDELKYTMEGTDETSFNFDESTLQFTTRAGVTYDYEDKSSYSVQVKVEDDNGGDDTVDVTINLTDVDEPPSAPTGLNVTPTLGSATSLDASWTAPANDGKPEISGYDLQFRIAGTEDWENGAKGVEGTSVAIADLIASTSYEIQVRASTIKVSDGAESDTVAVTINLANVIELPSAPTGLTVSPTLGVGGSLDASWTAPTNTGEPAVIDYDLQYGTSSTGPWTNGPQGVTGTSSTIPDLNATRTRYFVQVRARNVDGKSGWSGNTLSAIESRWRGERIANEASHLTLGGQQLNSLFNWGGNDRTGNHRTDGVASGEEWLFQPDGERVAVTGPASFAEGEYSSAPGAVPGGLLGTVPGSFAGAPAGAGLGRALPELRDVLLGSSFFYSASLANAGGQQEAPGQWALWGDVAATRFDGTDGALTLDGEVATGTVGADLHRGRWLGGVALSYSEGEGCPCSSARPGARPKAACSRCGAGRTPRGWRATRRSRPRNASRQNSATGLPGAARRRCGCRSSPRRRPMAAVRKCAWASISLPAPISRWDLSSACAAAGGNRRSTRCSCRVPFDGERRDALVSTQAHPGEGRRVRNAGVGCERPGVPGYRAGPAGLSSGTPLIWR